jgi:signal transduction histidine kinase
MGVTATTPVRQRPSELVSLSERMSYLRVMRVGFAVIVLGVGAFAPPVRGVSLPSLIGISAIYLALLLVGPELARRLGRSELLPVIGASLLIDGLYLAWVMYATGGVTSPLRFLIYLHIVAVTLLGSYRTGLKLAAWHSLLFFTGFYAQSAGLLEVKETLVSALPGRGGDFELVSMLSVAGLWVVALGTATFSALNEREVRGQKIGLERLATTVGEIDRGEAASEISRILVDRLCGGFGFTRGAVLASALSDDLTLMAYRGPGDAPEAATGLDPVMERAWNHRETVLVREVDPEVDSRLGTLFPGGRNLLIVPLFLDHGYRLGILVLEHPGREDRIKRWIVAMVEQSASHAALAIHNAWLLDEIKQKLEENRTLQTELMSSNLALEIKVEERTHELSESLRDLRMADEQRQRLLSRLVNAEEEERRRIAGDIHDGPVQQIVNAGMRLQVLRKRLTDPSQIRNADMIARAVDGSADGLRNLLFDLRPVILDRKGLEPALLQYLSNLDGDMNVSVDNRLRNEPPGDPRIIMYRIAQEALVNVRKHAIARSVKILLDESRGGFLMRIQDDGAGFSPPEMVQSAPGHLGLSFMRERAEMAGGWCTVRSFPGGGTTVEFWVPRTQVSSNGSGAPHTPRPASLVLP